MVEPKFATPRDERFPTRGTLQGLFARHWLGRTFMPWQQHLADVSGEYDPETGLPRYPLVIVPVQRQAGKSDLLMCTAGERCFSVPNFRSWYTAQTGRDARDQFLKFGEEVIEGTPLDMVVRTLRGNGHEVMRFPNGSTIRPHPPSDTALHGKQVDRNDIDEAWAFDSEQGAALMQAASPAKLTRPGAQTFIWSAGGTAASTWLAELVARGRAGEPGICYVEYGIPDDLPLDDLQAIAEHHPAYGHTISLASIEAMRRDIPDDGEFARAAGNRWTEVIGGGMPLDKWEAIRWDTDIPDDAQVAYGAARAADGTHVVLCAAADIDGVTVVEVVDLMGSHDAAARIEHLMDYGDVAVGGTGASGPLADDLSTRQALDLTRMTGGQEAAACAYLLDSLDDRAIRFRRHPALDAAVGAAALRSVGDGGKVWAQARSSAPIASIVAGCAAAWNLRRTREDTRGQVVVAFG
jgi:hypothetical protein